MGSHYLGFLPVLPESSRGKSVPHFLPHPNYVFISKVYSLETPKLGFKRNAPGVWKGLSGSQSLVHQKPNLRPFKICSFPPSVVMVGHPTSIWVVAQFTASPSVPPMPACHKPGSTFSGCPLFTSFLPDYPCWAPTSLLLRPFPCCLPSCNSIPP